MITIRMRIGDFLMYRKKYMLQDIIFNPTFFFLLYCGTDEELVTTINSVIFNKFEKNTRVLCIPYALVLRNRAYYVSEKYRNSDAPRNT